MGNEFVMVPRELLDRVLDPITSEVYINAKHEICALMAEPAMHQCDPVAPVINAEQVLGAYQFASFGPANHLRGTTNWCAAFAQELNHRIGADTDEVERIGKELREVREERDDLRRRVDDFQSRSHGIKNLSVIEQLNDKLAERDALLLKVRAYVVSQDRITAEIDAALSASTAHPGDPIDSATFVSCTPGQGLDPGSPSLIGDGIHDDTDGVARSLGASVVERDERVEFEQWLNEHVANHAYQGQVLRWHTLEDASEEAAWDAWQARANLEKKPC